MFSFRKGIIILTSLQIAIVGKFSPLLICAWEPWSKYVKTGIGGEQLHRFMANDAWHPEKFPIFHQCVETLRL